jgi:hypothetical protein
MSEQASESDVMYDPPYIDPISFREWHALLDGFYCGIHGSKEHEYEKEKHYWRSAWIVGDVYDRLFR